MMVRKRSDLRREPMMIRRVGAGLTPDRKARIASDTEVDIITDLTLGLYGLPICPLRSTAGSVIAPQCPSIAIMPLTNPIEVLAVVMSVSLDLPRAISLCAPLLTNHSSFPRCAITKYSNILVREELFHEEDCFAVRSRSLCRRRLCPGWAHRARQEGLTCSSKSHPKRQRYAYPGS